MDFCINEKDEERKSEPQSDVKAKKRALGRGLGVRVGRGVVGWRAFLYRFVLLTSVGIVYLGVMTRISMF